MAHLVDSSVWVALFIDFDAQHRKAAQILQKLSGTVYMTYGVVAEVVTVLAYKHSKQQADNFISYIQDNQDIKVINDDATDEMDFYITIPERISFVDASLLFLSQKLDSELVTFDKQLERVAKRLG